MLAGLRRAVAQRIGAGPADARRLAGLLTAVLLAEGSGTSSARLQGCVRSGESPNCQSITFFFANVESAAVQTCINPLAQLFCLHWVLVPVTINELLSKNLLCF